MKAINVIIAIIATLFTAGVAGSILLSAVLAGFGKPAVTLLGVAFAVIIFGVGVVSIVDAIDE